MTGTKVKKSPGMTGLMCLFLFLFYSYPRVPGSKGQCYKIIINHIIIPIKLTYCFETF